MTTEMWLIAIFRIGCSLPVLRWPLAGAFIAIFGDLSDLFLRDWLDLGGVKDYQRFDKLLDQVYMLTFLIVALRWQPIARNIAVALYVFRLAGVIIFEATDERGVLLAFPNLFEYWFIFVAALKTFGWEEPEATAEEAAHKRAEPASSSLGGSGSQPAQPTHPTDSSKAQSPVEREPQLSLTGSAPPGATQSYPFHHWPVVGPIARFAIPYRYSRDQLIVTFAVVIAAKLFHEYTLHVGQWFESFTATDALEAIWDFVTPPY
jgi:hypothetical protein